MLNNCDTCQTHATNFLTHSEWLIKRYRKLLRSPVQHKSSIGVSPPQQWHSWEHIWKRDVAYSCCGMLWHRHPSSQWEHSQTRPALMRGCQRERNWMESEFSCEKDVPNTAEMVRLHAQWRFSTVSSLLKDIFWSLYLVPRVNSNRYFVGRREWLLSMCICIWKIAMLKAIFVICRGLFNSRLRYTFITEVFRGGKREGMSQKHKSRRMGQAINQPSYLLRIPTTNPNGPKSIPENLLINNLYVMKTYVSN